MDQTEFNRLLGNVSRLGAMIVLAAAVVWVVRYVTGI